MNVNFGLFPPVEMPPVEDRRLRGKEKSLARKRAMSARALSALDLWLGAAREAAE